MQCVLTANILSGVAPEQYQHSFAKRNLASAGVINRYRTSFSEYKERATMSRSFFVSAWNSCLETEPSNESQTQPINFCFRARLR